MPGITLAAIVCLFASTGPTPEIRYDVHLWGAQTQTVRIEMHVPTGGRDSIDLALPAWRPGKYLILDPSGTIRTLEATDASGAPLEVRKRRKSLWNIQCDGAETVRVTYDVYANSIRDRTRHVDDTHAFLSGSSVFLFAPELRDVPVRVSFPDLPDGWEIATGLAFDGDDRTTVVAPDYDVLVDSPIDAGVHQRIEFDRVGQPHEIVIWGDVEPDRTQIIEDFGAIIDSQHAVFGDAPFDRYVFILHCAPGLRGGTEHLNSTVCSISRESLEDPEKYKRFLGLISHEYFHTWNVKQLRPAGLVPYDYLNENYTPLLWVAEGTTSYYDDLTLARTGLLTEAEYLDVLSDSIDGLRRRPGAAVQSLEESSFDAWVKFNKSWPDSPNSTVSFYSKGALVSMLLDLTLREQTDDAVSLDTVMRAMYERYPLAGGGYTTDDLRSMIESLAGFDIDSFLASYVRGTTPLEYDSALAHIGLELQFKPERDEADPDESADDDEEGAPRIEPYLGLRVSGRDGLAQVDGVRTDGPAYHAGLIHGDLIVSIDGRRVRPDGWKSLVKGLEIGSPVRLSFFRNDVLREIELDVPGRAVGKWTVSRVASPSDAQKASYEAWMHRAWPEDD